jgi:hypothetical protein
MSYNLERGEYLRGTPDYTIQFVLRQESDLQKMVVTHKQSKNKWRLPYTN